MIHFNDKAMNYAKRIAVISNTPAFLYKRIRQSDYTLELTRDFTSSELLTELLRINAKKQKTPTDLVAVYTLLVALSLKDDFNLELLNKLDLSWVMWAKEIISILNMKSCNNKYLKISDKPFEFTQIASIKNTYSSDTKVDVSGAKQE